jgi:hypothetical protein
MSLCLLNFCIFMRHTFLQDSEFLISSGICAYLFGKYNHTFVGLNTNLHSEELTF